MIALTGVQAALVVESVASVGTALRALVAVYKTFTIQDFERDFEATLEGEFKKVYYHNGTIISSDEANGFLSAESVVCVKRCCSSLTGWIPSGVFSIVTWAFIAQTVRHDI